MSRFTGAAAALLLLAGGSYALPAAAQSRPPASIPTLTADEAEVARMVAAAPDDRELKRLLHQGFAEAEPELFAVFSREFPEDLEEMETELVRRLRRGEYRESQIVAFGNEFGETLLNRYEVFFLKAPAANLHRTFIAMLAYMKAARRIDPGLCVALAVDQTGGYINHAPKTPELERLETRMIVSLLETLAAGRRTPSRHQPANDDDIEAMMDGFQRRGGNSDILGTLAGNTNPMGYSDESRCATAIALFEAMTEGDADRTARLVTEAPANAGSPI